jgi:glycosyltransferase involved in cell wall biosynthesis
MSQLEVVHVIAPAPVGGLEQVVFSLASGQHSAGTRVAIAALLSSPANDPAFLQQLETVGIVVHRIRCRGRDYRSQATAVAGIVRNHTAAIVHSHGYLPDGIALWARRQAPAALISTVHGNTGGSLRNRFYEWLDRRMLRRFDAVVAVSGQLLDDLAAAGISRSRLHLIRNAYGREAPPLDREPARRSLGLPPNGTLVAWIGRISREKGLDVLIDALAEPPAIQAVLAVIGDGPDRSFVQQRAATRGVEDRVRWLGMVPGSSDLLRAFDLVVISSRTEGTPMVLLEAMAAGVPIVTTRVGGIPDVVSGEEAILVPSEDPPALATAIRDALADPARSARRAGASRARLNSAFGLEPWVDAYGAAYRAAIAGTATGVGRGKTGPREPRST